MSNVTNLVITFSSLEDEEQVITDMKAFYKTEDGFSISSVKDKRLPQPWYGGTRRLECNILIGAYNYLDLEAFLVFLREQVNWEAPDLVQLFVKEQEDMKFRLIDLIS
jgi:hypothetical protein